VKTTTEVAPTTRKPSAAGSSRNGWMNPVTVNATKKNDRACSTHAMQSSPAKYSSIAQACWRQRRDRRVKVSRIQAAATAASPAVVSRCPQLWFTCRRLSSVPAPSST
jgi:hypothetical protein